MGWVRADSGSDGFEKDASNDVLTLSYRLYWGNRLYKVPIIPIDICIVRYKTLIHSPGFDLIKWAGMTFRIHRPVLGHGKPALGFAVDAIGKLSIGRVQLDDLTRVRRSSGRLGGEGGAQGDEENAVRLSASSSSSSPPPSIPPSLRGPLQGAFLCDS